MSSLIVLAAGRGTRFGGSKQTSAVGPAGEWLLDFALFDACRAGFTSAVLVVRPGSESDFEPVRERSSGRLAVRIVPQLTGLMPSDVERRPRTAPWGTGHAILAARERVDTGPFAVVNADDFYGAEAYRRAFAAVARADQADIATVVAMRLGRTLSAHGPVTRAVCQVEGGHVVRLEEVRGLARQDGQVVSAAGPIDSDALVSMNCWVLPARVMALLSSAFARFIELPASATKEFLLPEAVAGMVAEGQLTLEIAEAPGPWFGLTHAADRAVVVEALRQLTEAGVYRSPLWGA